MTRISTRLGIMTALGLLALLASAAAADPTPRAREGVLSEDDRAWVRAHRVVRVGVTEVPWPPYDLVSEDGEHRGITADYLELLATRTGFRLEQIRFKTFPEAFEALRRGEVDLLGSMARTPDREAVAWFTAPYASSPSVILSRKNDASIRNIKDLDGKKVALERGYAAREFLKRAAPGAVVVDVTTTLEALQAVASGDADAYTGSLVTSGYLIEKNYLTNLEVRGSSGFPTTELRFAVRKDLARLGKILDAALGALGEPEHDRIRARWVPGRGTGSPGRAIELTAAERAWVGGHRRIRVGVLANRRPLDILEKDGRHSGIGGDYLGLLASRLGLDFEPVPIADRRELAERLRNRELDMAPLVIPNSDRASYLAFTRPVFSMPWVIVTATDAPFITGVRDLRGKNVAVFDGNAAHVMLGERFPDVRIVIVGSDTDGLEAIAQGRALALAAPLATVSPLIQQQYASTMKVAAPLPEVPPDFVIGVRSDWVTLRDILDKGIATITDEEQGAIRSRWLGVTYRLALPWRRYLGVLIPLGATVGLVILVIAIWNRRLQGQIVQRRKAETALARAKEVADQASRAKSSFLATMSHEIRTPMNGVLGMLELLSLTRLETEQRATLNTARESARSLLGIIDDILDVSKIEAGRLDLRPEPTSVSQVMEGVFLVYSVAASRKNLLLMRTVDPRISPALIVDPLRLRQILNNFTSNALKFTAEGHVEIRAELLDRRDDADHVRFSVTDTGIGISPENQQKLFQPFVQAEGDTTRRFGGTGLGLAICRRLADMMGGQVEMHSEVGKGTTMTLTLTLPIGDPAQVTAADALAGPAHAAAHLAGRRVAPSAAAAAAEGTLVLVVDDHPTNRSLLERQLKALGYASETAVNGVEALERWSVGRFAMVITDCHMPEMDGYDLTRAIRREEAGRTLARMPVIACTANALQGEADVCFAAGMDDYLAKPVEMAALARALDRWLPIAAAAAPGSAPAGVEAGPGPIEPGPLAELTGGDQAMERDILLEYKAANDADVAALTQALARKDLPGVVRAAHRIKGASRMVGAGALAAVCASIEQAGRQDDWPAVAAEETRLRREVDRLNAYLVSVEAGGR